MIILFVCLIFSIFFISSVSAGDTNSTPAVENVSQIEIASGITEFDDVVCEDLVVPYNESYVKSNVNSPVLMNQFTGSIKNSDIVPNGAFPRNPNYDSHPFLLVLSDDTYNVLADNETSKNIKFFVNCNQPTGHEKVSIETYKDNKLLYKIYDIGPSPSLVLPVGLYKVVFKSENPNISEVVFDISVTTGKSFYDLNRIIKGGKSKITLDRDYAYDSRLDAAFENGIEIGKSLTINGNGHTIDAKNKLRIFDVVSDNVTISNLTLLNGHSASYGGALLWEANNGVISNVNFINATSMRIGGAIYLNGKNITLDRAQFINSTSGWTGDLIYLGHNFGNTTVKSCNLDDLKRIIDGRKVNLTQFASQINMPILGCSVDMSKIIFDILAFGGEHAFTVNETIKSIFKKTIINTRNISYFGQIVNGTDFILTFYESTGYTHIIEEFSFVGAANTTRPVGDVVLDQMKDGRFNVSFTYMKYVTIKDMDDYKNAISLKASDVFITKLGYYSQALAKFGNDRVNCIKGLCVNFVKKLYLETHSTWKPKKMGFDAIYINGNHSVIYGDAGKRDSRKWAVVDEGYTLTVTNITIMKFNNAIVNKGGICMLEHVSLTKNKMKYWIDRDWGAAILNAGLCICTNCSFTDNYCCNGGAIFNQGSLTLNNCYFHGNNAYKKGNNVLTVDKSVVYLDGKEINGSSGPIKHVKSISTGLEKFLKVAVISFSFISGVVAGVFTSPVGGAAIGAGVGALLGGLASAYINAHHYDIHYNRLKATLILTSICVAAGVAGGILGGYAAQYSASSGTYGGIIKSEYTLNPALEFDIPWYNNGWISGEGYNAVIKELPVFMNVYIV